MSVPKIAKPPDARQADHARDAPTTGRKLSLWQRLRGLISDFPKEERSSGIRPKGDGEANDNRKAESAGTLEAEDIVDEKRVILSDGEQLAHAMSAASNGLTEDSYAMLLSGAYTSCEAQMALIPLITEPEMAVRLLRAGILYPDGEAELMNLIRTARETVISNVLASGRFARAKKIAVFLPDGAQEDRNTIILPYIMDRMMANGKEIASFQDPDKEVVSYKIEKGGEIHAGRMDNLDQYFPDLILLPAVNAGTAIPDLRLDDKVKFDPYSGKPLPTFGRYLIGVSFEYQIQESLGNEKYAAIVDEMVSEKRGLNSSRPPPSP